MAVASVVEWIRSGENKEAVVSYVQGLAALVNARAEGAATLAPSLPQVTVTATDADGSQYSIALAQTGPSQAVLNISPVDGGASESHALFDVVRYGDGTITCDTPVLFSTADVTITTTATSVEVLIDHVLFITSPQTYTLSAADGAALATWLQNFPGGPGASNPFS
jgi:hypothetical protein